MSSSPSRRTPSGRSRRSAMSASASCCSSRTSARADPGAFRPVAVVIVFAGIGARTPLPVPRVRGAARLRRAKSATWARGSPSTSWCASRLLAHRDQCRPGARALRRAPTAPSRSAGRAGRRRERPPPHRGAARDRRGCRARADRRRGAAGHPPRPPGEGGVEAPALRGQRHRAPGEPRPVRPGGRPRLAPRLRRAATTPDARLARWPAVTGLQPAPAALTAVLFIALVVPYALGTYGLPLTAIHSVVGGALLYAGTGS